MASPDLARLAKHVKARRLELGLARRRAAELAGMSKDTWQRIEEEDPGVRAMSYAKVDPVLGWAPGSCQAILAGREAVPTKPSESTPGVDISQPPTRDLNAARNVIQLAMIATTSGLTAEEIRELSERAINDLHEGGFI
jgi:DNA-binding XRE family transcriptional regulator